MSRLTQRIENFNKAYNILSLSNDAYKKDRENVIMHMALVQSFEVCVELGWKILKDYLEQEKGIIAPSPKDSIKEAFSNNVIKNGQIWMDMLKDRNTASHEYNQDKLDNTLEKISTTYFAELTVLKNWVENEQ